MGRVRLPINTESLGAERGGGGQRHRLTFSWRDG